jgi:hypothetical protein
MLAIIRRVVSCAALAILLASRPWAAAPALASASRRPEPSAQRQAKLAGAGNLARRRQDEIAPVLQFQGVSGSDLAQFRDTAHQVALWPAEHKTGNVSYSCQDAK